MYTLESPLNQKHVSSAVLVLTRPELHNEPEDNKHSAPLGIYMMSYSFIVSPACAISTSPWLYIMVMESESAVLITHGGV